MQARVGDKVVGSLPYHAFNKVVMVKGMQVDQQHQRQGIASGLMDQLVQHAGSRVIDHGERTPEGRDWWRGYSASRPLNPRQHRGGKLSKRPLY